MTPGFLALSKSTATWDLWANEIDLARMRENFDLTEAVTEVYQALRSPVYSYLVSILGRPSDAEDLAQETFVRLFQELRGGHVVAHVRT